MLLMLLFCMSNSAWAVVTKSTWGGTAPIGTAVSKTVCNNLGISGSGTEAEPYVISTADQFVYFASKMNTNTAWWELAPNIEIDLNNIEWTYGKNNWTFKGHFNGNSSTISNMKIETNATGKGWGLFSNIQGSSATNHAEIKNLTIKNFIITTPTTGSYAAAQIGLLVGKANGNTDIENITVTGGTIKVDVEATGAHNVAGLVGQLATNENNIKNCSVSNVTITSGTAESALQKKEFYVGGITGNAGNYAVITGNTVSNLTVTIYSKTNGNNIIGGIVGKITGVNSTAADGFPMGKRALVQKNTVTSPHITMNGSVDVANFYLGGMIGWIAAHTNAFNNKVQSPTISLNNNINATSYVGGAIGYQDGYTYVDGMTVNGTGAINGPSSDKTVKNGVTFFVGGYLGYMLSSGTAAFQANKFKNIAVTGMSINLAHYLPQSSIQNHKFSVGGIAGSVNAPNMKADYTWAGMPENLIFKGGKIYAPWASTSPTVSNFNAAAMTHQNMTPDVVTTIDNIEKAKVNTWYYNDYELGLSNEFLSSDYVIDQNDPAQHLKLRKNYSATPAADGGIKYLTVNNSTFAKSNRYLDSERDSKTVLWWTQQASMDKSKGTVAAATCFTANEQPIYPQSGATSAQAGNLTDYPHYMYFFQGVANAKYAGNTEAEKIVAGIEANFTNNILPAVATVTGASASVKTVTITNEGETRRGFDARTLTVTVKGADGTDITSNYTYQWYVDGAADGTGTTKSLTPHWKDGKGVVVNVLNGTTVVATASYGFAPGVMKTATATDKVRSDISSRGTKGNPYIIDCENALRQLSYLSTVHTGTYWETLGKPAAPYATNQTQGHYNRAYYEMSNDITLSDDEFTPISHVGYSSDATYGTYNTNWIFQGVFDGKGHKISNINITWKAGQYNAGANIYTGLFGCVGNAAAAPKWGDGSTNSNTVIKNLIIDGAKLTHDTENTTFAYPVGTNANYAMVGVLAGIVTSNTTIQNIEIRNSKITDEGSNDYSLAGKGLYVGGAIGSVQAAYNATANVPASTQIQHIAAQVDITLAKPTILKESDATQTGSFNVGGIIGRYVATGATKADVEPTLPSYTIYSGTINASKAWVSPVVASLRNKDQQTFNFTNHSKHWEGNNKTDATQVVIKNALYYNYKIGGNKITDTYPANTCGLGNRTLTTHTDGSDAAGTYSAQKYQGVNYGARYVDVDGASLEFMNGEPFENYNWVWSNGFVHMSTEDYVEARISRDGDTFTATLIGAEARGYKWQATFDGTNWYDISNATEAEYAAPKSLKPKYIVALISDGTTVDDKPKYYRTLVELVEPNKNLIHPEVKKKGDKYVFELGSDGVEGQFETTYEWFNNTKTTPFSPVVTDTDLDASKVATGNIVWCKVTVTELGVTVYEDYLLSGATMVYVSSTNGVDNTEDPETHIMGRERGWTPETPVQTLDHANSLLKTVAQGGTVDNNVIVIMGELSEYLQSSGRNPATITGKDHGGIIKVCQVDQFVGSKSSEHYVNRANRSGEKGANCYVLADTKFEHLTFKGNNGNNTFIECHGHDVTFGHGLVMTNFAKLSQNHGNVNNALEVPEFTIILTATNLPKVDIDEYTNRTKPQVVTFQSGHYGRLMGGRFTQDFFANSENTAHSILGSAAKPLWAVVNVEIDKDNEKTDGAGNTYGADINAIIAGLTDGTMYGDYTINFYGGHVAYIVGGNQGNAINNGDAVYTPVDGESGTWGQWPNASYFGRTVINIEDKSAENSSIKPITVGNLYAGGLGRKVQSGNDAKAAVDMYMYGRTEVNVKSGTISGSVYGGGVGGVIGANPWDAHVPYDASTSADNATTAIQDKVQYGDNRVTGHWNSVDPATAAMAKVTLHNLNDAGTDYVTENLDLSESSTTVNVIGGAVNGNVYGGGYGKVDDMPAASAVQGIGSVFGTTNINITGGTITGNIYGGSEGDSHYHNTKNKYGQTITHIAEMNGTVNLNISGTEDHYPTINGKIFGAGKGIATAGGEEYADIARTGNSSLGEKFKSTININIDLPESHPFTNNIYGGGEMGKVDGEIYVNIKNGIIEGNIFGAGLGEVGHTETKAMVTGNTYVNMFNAKVNASTINGTGNVYGGGELGKVLGNTNVNMEDGIIENNVYGGGLQGTVSALAKVTLNGSHVHGNVFGGGEKAVVGTAYSTGDRDTWAKANGTSVVMSGDNARVFGDIFGGGNEAKVEGNTSVYLYNGMFGGNIFGGGNGVLNNNNVPVTFADVTNNTSVYLDGTNVMWNILWGKETIEGKEVKKVIEWDGTWDGKNRNKFIGGTIDAPIFLNPHNVYGGGNKACRVAGNDSVFVVKGFANAALLRTDIWKNSFYDNNNPHFYVFGGGYGPFTTAKNTFVNVGVKGEYEDATTDEQLAKELLSSFRKQRKFENNDGEDQQVAMAKSAGSRSKDSNLTTDANSDPDKHLGVYDNSFGIPLYTVLGVLGGGYSGLISGNTNVTVGGDTFIHRVYGGGYGSSTDYGTLEASVHPSSFTTGLAAGATAYDTYNGDDRNLRNILGEVGGKTDVTVNGAFIYGDVFGGGAGVESQKNGSGEATHDFVDMARVRGIGTTVADAFTKVTISDNAQIFGSVYGGGDIANVGLANTSFDGNSLPSYTPSTGTLSNVRSFVNIIGGDIYGEVFGGGGGRQLFTLNEAGTAFIQTTAGTDVLGRIEGNTLVHIANTPARETLTGEDEEPNIWQRIYGGGNLGSVNGNTKVWVEGGNLGHNIIGGGNGYAADDSPESQSHGTYANVYGNTDITVDGGSIIWDKAADSQGNTITWTNARKQLVQSEKEMRQLFVSDPETIREMLIPYIDNRFFTAENGNSENVKFPINHNIYGGGRYACRVGTYDDGGNITANTGKSTVTLNHSIINDKDLLDIRTVAGLCWYSIVNNTSEPQFSVFGGGYGANTKVGNTVVNVQIGKVGSYAAKADDDAAWNEYETMLQNDWSGISNEERINLYGGTNENAYRRYRTSRYALSLGVPNHTYMNVYGGGYSGYVVDNTDVNVDGKSGIRNVYGGGLGAVKDRSVAQTLAAGKLVEASLLKGGDTNSSSLNYGKVGGNTDVDIQGGIISLNVYGGGAGVESRYLKAGALSTKADGGTLTDFPLMAHVAGKTNVNITGTVTDDPNNSSIKIDGTIIYGKVFGGGDVANVGDNNKKDNEGANAMASSIVWVDPSGTVASQATDASSTAFTSSITIDGGLIYSEVLAGGSGRAKSECNNYETLGGIYGNSRVIVKDNNTASFSPWLWNSIYGGGENGTVYGNALVSISGGHLGYNIFGGGWGNVNEEEGISDDKRVSSADIKRNSFVYITGGEYVLTQMWNPQTRAWYPNNQHNSPQFDYDTKKFLINHNIYGGGNYACTVAGSTYVKMTKGLLKETTQVTYGGTTNLFASDEWRDVYNKTGSPHFSVYGGGYGADTHISGNTNLDINLTGAKTISASQADVDANNLYKQFYSEQSVMDITGGGYSGNVVGKANVKISGNTFARRILGGGFYGPVGETQVDILSVDCDEIFGGGLMGDIGVKPNDAYALSDLVSGDGAAVLNIGKSGASNSEIYIHKNIYGGNDVSGNIYRSANLTIYGGNILGNVYGAGNGNYLYAQGTKDTKQVTVNEYYKTAETTYDLVYTVPSDRLSSSIAAAPEAERMVNVNSYRPATQNVNIKISGTSTSGVNITGNVFGGGNSATVNEIFENVKPTVNLDLGDYLTIGGVFLGCDGDAMFDDKTNYMNAYQDVNKVDLTHTIDWINNPGNKAVKYQYLPVDENDRPKVYKTNLDLYFQPVEMAVQPKVKWNGSATGNVTSTTITTFVCGGNRGNMNVTPDNEGKIVDITFPAGLTIIDKIVGGCNNANITYKTTHHEGGYLLGKRNPTAASASGDNDIALTVKCQFKPSVGASGVMEGGNVYGGCYKSGTINGDIFVDVQTNMLSNITTEQLTANKAKDGIALGNVYGAGYGNDSYVYGNTTVLFGKGVAKDQSFPTTLTTPSPAKSMFGGISTLSASPVPVVQNGAAANFIYGGGQQGNLIGNSLVRIYNGTVASSVCGGSYAGYMWGSTQVLVGYPKYYTCQKSGIYNLKRADIWNTSYKNWAANEADKEQVIKQKIFLMEGDVVSEEVYDAIQAANVLNSSELSAAFGATVTTTSPANASLTWDNIDINIAEAVYGGGYSLASGSSVAAGTYTVKKYDEEQNLNAELTTTELGALNSINGDKGSKGFGGNTTVLVWDQPTNAATAEHIAISSQEMTDVTSSVSDTDDLFGYYYKLSGSNNFKYIFETGYKKANLSTEASGSEKKIYGTDGHVYTYNGEGGMYGDGHLSFAEGFRSGELYGYGFSQHTPENAKIMNTFQRMDLLRVTDCAVRVLGSRDYTVNQISTTPYSIIRIGELQMRAENVKNGETKITATAGNLAAKTLARSRNFIGLANNIHYIGAIDSNVGFEATYRGTDGTLGSKTYKTVKQEFIDAYYDGKDKRDGASESEFQKRNDATAANMIGISSGFAMKVQNVYTTESEIKEDYFYGPIVGVVEVNLTDTHQDEAGAYVYADNIHDDDNHFLESTGNFVFPYNSAENRYVVDDCYPKSFVADGAPTNVEAHYWYVTGWDYYYNAHITGYTYNHTINPDGMNFDSENTDELMNLMGTNPGADIKIKSITWHSNHPAEFASDLEKRNTLAASTADNVDAGGHDVAGKYTLSIGTFGDTSVSDTNNHNLSFKDATGTDADKYTSLAADEGIHIRLNDKADNSGKDYYQAHLSKPSLATIVLTADAKDGEGNARYKYIPQTGVSVGSTFTEADGYYSYDAVTGDYTLFKGTTIADKTYYKREEGTYTYTIYLTIDYVLGPSYTGNLKIHNCALPGEMIKIDKGNIQLTGDQTFSQTGTTYTFGKIKESTQDPGRYDFDGDTYTYTVGEEPAAGDMLNGVRYDKDGDYILVPAYYFMNGYGVQYGFKVSGITEPFPVAIDPANTLLVHNYHRMLPRSSSGEEYALNQHLDLAAQRAAAGDIPEPRIYLVDNKDLTEFGRFLNEKAPATQEVPNPAVGSKYDFGANMQFFLQNDITAIKPGQQEAGITLSPYVAPAGFKGILHGDGHVISGLDKLANKYLLGANTGNIYNLGLTAGVITNGDAAKVTAATAQGASESDKTALNNSLYHCCYTYDPVPATVPDASATVPHVVYRIDGTAFTGYTEDDWRYGKVAYDLNQYYLDKRYVLGGNAAESAAANYVENYYANGDYLYADYSGDNHYKGSEYLRTAARPNYGEQASLHDTSHTIDASRAQGYNAAVGDTPATCTGYQPLFEEVKVSGSSASVTTGIKNDYLFWGQRQNADTKLAGTGERGAVAAGVNVTLPASITADLDLTLAKSVHLVNDMANRVYRAAGYYSSTVNNGYYYNHAGYAHNNKVTAIDFYGYSDPTSGEPKVKTYTESGNIGGSVGSATGSAVTFYQPIADYGLNSFSINKDVTRNLLLYANSNADLGDAGALNSQTYRESTVENEITAHVIGQVGETDKAPQATYLHLVERSTTDKQFNNDLCVPVQFTVSNRAWYVRKPLKYAEANNDAWEGICLPFTVNRTEASQNGEITHFYGTASDAEKNALETNCHTLHHEYWLRGMTSVSDGTGMATNKKVAMFKRPGADLFNQGTAMTYTYNNPFFVDTYGDNDYNWNDASNQNRWYNDEHTYSDYIPLTQNVPYVISFPGYRYYEFDLSSQFYDKVKNNSVRMTPEQSVTFNAYGPESDVVNHSTIPVVVPVTGQIATAADGYDHVGTFIALDNADYGMVTEGTSFSDDINSVLPFRTYIRKQPSAGKSVGRSSQTTRAIIIGNPDNSQDNIDSEFAADPESGVVENGMRIYPQGQKVIVESTYSTTLNVLTPAGAIYRIIDIRPGRNTFSGFRSGIYIVGTKKVFL